MIINSVACMQKNSKKFENCVGFSTSRSERVKKKLKCCAISEFGNSFALEDFIEKNQTKHSWRI